MQGLRNKKTDIRNATGRQAASEAIRGARRLEYGGVSCTNEWTTKLSARQSKTLRVWVEFPARTLLNNQIFPVAIRYGVTPVPIPNTTVKTISAEGTVLETIRENRWLPDPLRDYSSAG